MILLNVGNNKSEGLFMQRSLSFVLFLIWSVSAQAQQSPDGNWPSFRGPYAAGVADEQNLPDAWSGETGHNIKWKIRIPGLAHSSPIIWGDKLIVTTAISGRGEADFKAGLYGEGTASDDHSVHRWDVICLNKKVAKFCGKQPSHRAHQSTNATSRRPTPTLRQRPMVST